MENTTNKDDRPRAHFYQKDYSKLEIIFNKAVERSRQKKIIHYASDRLYSAATRKEMAQNSFKPVSSAEPILKQDVQTEIIDLETTTPEESIKIEREKLFDFFTNAQTSTEESLTSTEALKAYETLVDVSEEKFTESPSKEKSLESLLEEPVRPSIEEISQPFEVPLEPEETPLEETIEVEAQEPITIESSPENPEFVELKNILSELEEIPESKDVESAVIQTEPEPEPFVRETPEPEPSEPVEEKTEESILGPERAREFFEEEYEETEPAPIENTTLEDARKDLSTSRLVVIAAAIFLGIYVAVFYVGFSGYDYVALVLCLLGFFLAFVLRPRALIVTCILMLVALIACMVYTIIRTSETILFYHYLWFLFIPISISSSYAFFKSRQRLNTLEEEERVQEPEESEEPEEDVEELLKNVQPSSLADEVISIEDIGETTPQESDDENKTEEASIETVLPEESVPEFNLDETIPEDTPFTLDATLVEENFSERDFDDPNYFDEDIDAYETLVEEPVEAPRENIELSDTYNNSFDWGNILDDDERTNNTSVIDEIGEDALLSEFVETANTRAETDSLADILSDMEGQDEENISVNDGDTSGISWSDFLNS